MTKLRSGKIAGEEKMKVWFPLEPLLNKFWKPRTEAGLADLAQRLGIGVSTLIRIVDEPNYMMRESTADRYAIRLRLSSLHDMG